MPDPQMPLRLSVDALKRLFAYDTQAALGLHTRAVWATARATVHDLVYASPKGGLVPALLVVPDGPGPFAGVIIQHGVAADEAGVSLGRALLLPYASYLAPTGAVCLLIEAPFARGTHAHRPAGPFTFTAQDRDEQVQLIIDLRRAVDILSARPDVDVQRLAYIGWSYGAAIGGLLAAVEQRINAYVLAVGSGGVVAHFTGTGAGSAAFRSLSPERQQAWQVVMEPLEPLHYIEQARPAALLFQAALHDQAVPIAEARAFQQAGSEPKRIIWYDAGHRLNAAAIRDQIAWLEQHVGIDANQVDGTFSRA
jgi:dienelactone hydrolase